MNVEPYLTWVMGRTPTCWWHDSADPREVDWAIDHGAVGMTTNPYLANLALAGNRQLWAAEIRAAVQKAKDAESRAEALMCIPVLDAARKFLPLFERSEGKQGWVCAQVNPARVGNRDSMLAMARRFADWAPNTTVKLPATAAGLDVLEDCVAEGITVTATVSFTVAQVLAVAERHRQGMARARARGVKPGHCFAVLMVGRLDDYLRELAHDLQAGTSEADIKLAGIAVAKRAATLFQQRGYETGLIIAAFRGLYHVTELVGGNLILSTTRPFQEPLLAPDIPHETRLDRPVPEEVIARLSILPDFVRAHEPAGMTPAQFLSYGLSQRTLTFFTEAGWKLLEQA